MLTLTGNETAFLKRYFKEVAVGRGEDVAGVLMLNGAFKELPGDELVALADKLKHTPTTMTEERYKALVDSNCFGEDRPEQLRLTDTEIAEGWHWCPDWDYLLVGPGCAEKDCCTCKL